MDAWNILVVVVLALILLLILPMVAARNGTKSFTQALTAPLHRKKKRGPLGLEVEPEKKPERHVNNSMQGELTAIVSQLITFTKRQHYTLVYPGTIQEGGQLTTTLALVVTPGGVVGLNLYLDFVGQPTMDALAAHVEHFLNLNGEKTVCLGGDLDGCEALAAGMTGMQDAPKLYDALKARGYSEALLEDIFWNNLRRLI